MVGIFCTRVFLSNPSFLLVLLIASYYCDLSPCPRPLMMYELRKRRGLVLRGLAHEWHWKSPLGDIFEKYGAVKVSPPLFSFFAVLGCVHRGSPFRATLLRDERCTARFDPAGQRVRAVTPCFRFRQRPGTDPTSQGRSFSLRVLIPLHPSARLFLLAW